MDPSTGNHDHDPCLDTFGSRALQIFGVYPIAGFLLFAQKVGLMQTASFQNRNPEVQALHGSQVLGLSRFRDRNPTWLPFKAPKQRLPESPDPRPRKDLHCRSSCCGRHHASAAVPLRHEERLRSEESPNWLGSWCGSKWVGSYGFPMGARVMQVLVFVSIY